MFSIWAVSWTTGGSAWEHRRGAETDKKKAKMEVCREAQNWDRQILWRKTGPSDSPVWWTAAGKTCWYWAAIRWDTFKYEHRFSVSNKTSSWLFKAKINTFYTYEWKQHQLICKYGIYFTTLEPYWTGSNEIWLILISPTHWDQSKHYTVKAQVRKKQHNLRLQSQRD